MELAEHYKLLQNFHMLQNKLQSFFFSSKAAGAPKIFCTLVVRNRHFVKEISHSFIYINQSESVTLLCTQVSLQTKMILSLYRLFFTVYDYFTYIEFAEECFHYFNHKSI